MCSTILQSYRLFNIPRRKPPTPLPPPLSWGAEDWLAYSSPRITLLHSETFLLVSRYKCIIIFQWWKKIQSLCDSKSGNKRPQDTSEGAVRVLHMKAQNGEGGGGIQIECEGRSGRFDHDDHTMVDHLLDHLGSRALQSSCPQQCQPGWENRKPKSKRWCVAFQKQGFKMFLFLSLSALKCGLILTQPPFLLPPTRRQNRK